MPIPGDNGNPEKEKKMQEDRIRKVSETGAEVQKEVDFGSVAKPDSCVFGTLHK